LTVVVAAAPVKTHETPPEKAPDGAAAPAPLKLVKAKPAASRKVATAKRKPRVKQAA
jgi:hypothetical protein